jgi:hypothetical protein
MMAYPPSHGIPDKNRLIPADDLVFGQTPFDALDRGELLRLLQAYYVALSGAQSLIRDAKTYMPEQMWPSEGFRVDAAERVDYLLNQIEDKSTVHYKFFQTATELLFADKPSHGNPWYIDDRTKAMSKIICREDGRITPADDEGLRPIQWTDFMY